PRATLALLGLDLAGGPVTAAEVAPVVDPVHVEVEVDQHHVLADRVGHAGRAEVVVGALEPGDPAPQPRLRLAVAVDPRFLRVEELRPERFFEPDRADFFGAWAGQRGEVGLGDDDLRRRRPQFDRVDPALHPAVDLVDAGEDGRAGRVAAAVAEAGDADLDRRPVGAGGDRRAARVAVAGGDLEAGDVERADLAGRIEEGVEAARPALAAAGFLDRHARRLELVRRVPRVAVVDAPARDRQFVARFIKGGV